MKQVASVEVRSSCSVAIISQDVVLGVLAIGRLLEHAFTSDDVGLLIQIANQVAIAVEKALSFRKGRRVSFYLEEEIRPYNFQEIVGKSLVLKCALHLVETVARTVMERAMILSRRPHLEIPLSELQKFCEAATTHPEGASLQAIEREHILGALRESNWMNGVQPALPSVSACPGRRSTARGASWALPASASDHPRSLDQIRSPHPLNSSPNQISTFDISNRPLEG